MKAAERSSSALSAGRFANVVAALSLREVGVGSVPSRKEIDEALRNYD
jgi:sugar/nucleoside kinase (ribokinase family)